MFSLVVDEGSGKRVMKEYRGCDEIMKVKCEVGNDG